MSEKPVHGSLCAIIREAQQKRIEDGNCIFRSPTGEQKGYRYPECPYAVEITMIESNSE
jgi:hypothetical protein